MDPNLREQLTARLSDGRAVGYPNPDSCWEWALARDKDGYGRWNAGGRGHRAHRVTWELVHGPIPEGLQIDHQCRNRACVNPTHLRVVTPKVNATENNIGPTAANVAKTHCPAGHPYEGENLRVIGGSRYCNTCSRLRVREYQARRKASGRTMKPETPPRPVCRKGLHRLLDDAGNVLPALWVRPDGRRECRECRKAARKGEKARARARIA